MVQRILINLPITYLLAFVILARSLIPILL
jgi:hypothetical protein